MDFVRGATVRIAITFKDAAGATTNPPSAEAVLVYTSFASGKVTEEIPMTQNGSEWFIEWDSRVAKAGMVYGHARTPAPVPISAVNFQFGLIANAANKVEV